MRESAGTQTPAFTMRGKESVMTEMISLGEVLIDLTQTGTDAKGTPQFAAFPGGAPANVAVAAARLGGRVGFIGKVGRDSFGDGLRQTLVQEGVDTAGLYASEEAHTTLAIVSVDETGERSFAFYRDPGADTRLTAVEATRALDRMGAGAEPARRPGAEENQAGEAPYILHFGSLSLTDEPSRSAALAAVAHAREKGMLISYDPNYRPALWSSEGEAIRQMKSPLAQVDILKVSEEELGMLTGITGAGDAGTGQAPDGAISNEALAAGSRILADCGIQLVLVTLGSAGVYYRYGDATGILPGEKVKVSDTNGAGDTFLGAILVQLCRLLAEAGRQDGTAGTAAEAELQDAAGTSAAGKPAQLPLLMKVLTEDRLQAFLRYANRAAALTCSRPGAIPAMPHADELA